MSKIPPAAGCSSQKLIVYSQSSQVYNTMPKIRSHEYVKICLNKHHLKHHWGSNCEKNKHQLRLRLEKYKHHLSFRLEKGDAYKKHVFRA